MAAGAGIRAPKQWQLTKSETVTSFESWRQNLIYTLQLDRKFAPFIEAEWQKKTFDNPNRGLTNDAAPIPADDRLTAVQKSATLDLMLGMVANYCTVISRNSIVKQSTSLKHIWQLIRQHFGFQTSGAHFLDLSLVKLQPAERPEDLYQRLMAFFEDNLMTADGLVTHHGAPIRRDEDIIPTLENTIVVLWLQLINPGLPQLVKQKYGAELRNKSLASLKPEISQALSSLLDELRSIEDTRAMRTAVTSPNNRRQPPSSRFQTKRTKSCILCKTGGRPSHMSHNLSECRFLPESDRKYMQAGRTRMVCEIEDEESYEPEVYEDVHDSEEDNPNALLDTPTIRRVNVVQSPVLNTFYRQHPFRLTLDTGATTNMVRDSFAQAISIPIKPASQMARQADGITPLDVVGEVHCTVSRGERIFQLDALVVKQLDVDVLAGNPFLTSNDIAIRPAKNQIVIQGSEIIHYGPQPNQGASIRRTQAFLLRSPPRQTVVLPGQYVELKTPMESHPDASWALEPRVDSPVNTHSMSHNAWPSLQEIQSIDHSIRITNNTVNPVLLRRNEHLCQVRTVHTQAPSQGLDQPCLPMPKIIPASPYSAQISLDPDHHMPKALYDKFVALHREYDSVFDPRISKYNGASGNIQAVVNIGPTKPPQRKGRLPSYNHETLVKYQQKCDDFESEGILTTPEKAGVAVEYLNLSFLVKKPSGGERLVTSFGEVAQYCKPQPSLMPDVSSVLKDIGRWQYIIITDLRHAFYQIPLCHDSMKYCGIVTPFKGVRVYTRAAMGMPGSETVLEELMSRVLGDLVQEGFVAKIADDLFTGGDTLVELLTNWQQVLAALQHNNLNLNAPKTIICPKTATILGWIWSDGTLKASTHRVSALASVEPPTTVQGIRSFVGAYKFLSRVLPGHASYMDPLDQVTAGRQSREKIEWTEDLLAAFKTAQNSLSNCKTITIPRPDDCLWIITDGSVRERGIAATLYVLRDGKLKLAGFFCAKLRKHQVTWLPCEIEALCLGSAVKHFAPFIIQSKHTTQVLTDSRPCVQAYSKLSRGEFSNSSRVTTFLSTVSRYQVILRHIAGVANLPSDYTSRNPPNCPENNCQLCKFIQETEDSVIRSLSVRDIIDGSGRMPFTSRVAWQATQQECSSLRRTHSHLSQGTRPSKKLTQIPDVKRYLKCASIANDGLLIVKDTPPFQPVRERIVVPRSVIDGLLTAIHIRFDHPSQHQMKQLFTRYFHALDLDKALRSVCQSCHHCVSLQSVPTRLYPQTSTPPPDRIGVSFSLDVMRRYRQYILVLRETVSSYTLTTLIDNERHETLRDAIIILCAESSSPGAGNSHIRVDPAPGFKSLVNDPRLTKHGIRIDIGREKNTNKNPVAEHAIKELGLECLHLNPDGGPLNRVTLALATANMNSRIRKGGLSAKEVWTQRDQITGEQLPINDRQLIMQQHFNRQQNHGLSAQSKAHGKPKPHCPSVHVGDLVFLKMDRDKTKSREKYLVIDIDDDHCQVRTFTKSQFRSKCYDVKLIDCLIVKHTPVCQSPTDPVRGLEEDYDSDLEVDTDTTCPPPLHTCPTSTHHDPPTNLPPVPVEISQPPPICDMSPEYTMNPDETNQVNDPGIDANVTPETPDELLPTDLPQHDQPTSVATPPSSHRRSTRQRKAPTWQCSGQWDME